MLIPMVIPMVMPMVMPMMMHMLIADEDIHGPKPHHAHLHLMVAHDESCADSNGDIYDDAYDDPYGA